MASPQRGKDVMGLGETTKRGAVVWDFLATFIAAHRVFLSIYRRYERRVLSQARGRGVPRAELKLPPQDLWKLFHLPRLEALRELRLKPLRELGREIFGAEGDEGLMDAYCGHIYHEISILSEEHRSVGRFVQHHDPRRYRSLFDEVSGYYPLRLNRVLRFFRAARKRLDELLPRWSQERVVVRSAYLFGDHLARRGWNEGHEALYARMYPSGGVVRGYLEAGRSFLESGFEEHAGVALGKAMAAWEGLDPKAERPPGLRVAMEEVRELMAGLVPVRRRSQDVQREGEER